MMKKGTSQKVISNLKKYIKTVSHRSLFLCWFPEWEEIQPCFKPPTGSTSASSSADRKCKAWVDSFESSSFSLCQLYYSNRLTCRDTYILIYCMDSSSRMLKMGLSISLTWSTTSLLPDSFNAITAATKDRLLKYEDTQGLDIKMLSSYFFIIKQ